jgi:hypothetical protein
MTDTNKTEEKPKEMPTSTCFPFIITGNLDGIEVCIPLISSTDLDSYLESLHWVARKQNCTMDLLISLNGNKVGEIKFDQKVH